jgi:Raf kinase inhibitor-like YbhB/YbcL family protein
MSHISVPAWVVVAAATLLCAGCGPKAERQPPKADGNVLVVTSPAFANGAPIPAKYTADGDDVSPPLQWTGVPEKARSVALICDDPDAPGGTWVHWLLYNMPPRETGLAEGIPEANELPNGSMHGLNDFGRPGYGGPAPPSGKVHRYRFHVYALDAVLILKPRALRSELERAMRGHILAEGELIGTYKR